MKIALRIGTSAVLAAIVGTACVIALTTRAGATSESPSVASEDSTISTWEQGMTNEIAPNTVSELSQSGIIVAAMNPADAASLPTDPVEALRAVGENLNLGDRFSVTSAVIANVTTTRQGQKLSNDPNDTRVKPTIDHQNVWVVSMSSVRVPLFGRAGSGATSPTFEYDDMVAFVDPVSHEFLGALSGLSAGSSS